MDLPKKIFLGKTSFVDHTILILLISDNHEIIIKLTIIILNFLLIHGLLMKT